MTLIGIDVGGTNSRVGVVSSEGRLLARAAAPTDAARGSAATIETWLDLIRSGSSTRATPILLDPLAIGIAISGRSTSTPHRDQSYTLGGWPPTDIVSPFRAAFPGAVVIAENDANAAAVGEWRIAPAAARIVCPGDSRHRRGRRLS